MPIELPLLAGQASIWAAEQLGTAGLPYNFVSSISYDRSDVSADHLAAALDELIDTHRCLHARVVSERGTPKQLLDTPPLVERRAVDDDDPAALRGELHRHEFDLAAGPLHQFHIVTSPTRVHLVSCQHHVVWDGMSRGIFVEDLAAAVRGEPRVEPTPYADAVAASLELEQAALSVGADHVVDRLADAEPVDLPPTTDAGHGSTERASEALATATRRLQQEGHSTAALMVAGVSAALLPAGDEDRLLGLVVTTRPGRDVRTMGCFVNTVPLVVGPATTRLDAAAVAVRAAVRDRHLPMRVVSTTARRAGVGFAVDERFLASMSAARTPDDLQVDLPRGNRSLGVTLRYWDVNDEVIVGLDHNLGLLPADAADSAIDRFVDELISLAG